jgi:hypothetical protein
MLPSSKAQKLVAYTVIESLSYMQHAIIFVSFHFYSSLVFEQSILVHYCWTQQAYRNAFKEATHYLLTSCVSGTGVLWNLWFRSTPNFAVSTPFAKSSAPSLLYLQCRRLCMSNRDTFLSERRHCSTLWSDLNILLGDFHLSRRVSILLLSSQLPKTHAKPLQKNLLR